MNSYSCNFTQFLTDKVYAASKKILGRLLLVEINLKSVLKSLFLASTQRGDPSSTHEKVSLNYFLKFNPIFKVEFGAVVEIDF